MDITKFIVQGRDQARLYGDYSTYHSQLAKRILNCRKKLGIATKNRGKFHPKDTVTAEEIAKDHQYVYLLLLTSERAWAQAMNIKSSHAADEKGINRDSRNHIVSRLTKAARAAENLVSALSESDASGASTKDVLEAKAYASLINGAKDFEQKNWQSSLRSYAVSRIIYDALATATKGDIFKDLLTETIDPSIRYAAYQLKTPRTVPIPVIARRAFPESDQTLVEQINKIDSTVLGQGDAESGENIRGAENVPDTLTWRSRQVKIEDAQIATAWAAVGAAHERLSEELSSVTDKLPHEVANAYDDILTATQDAVDATKQAMDEMKSEGVGPDDSRMQSLQMTRTAVNYEMISWRIGRNRVLTGPYDGATEEYGPLRRGKKKAKAGQESTKQEKELPIGKKIVKLKEKVALYDGTLQNLESIKELPGVAADQELATKLDGFTKYFSALKCLSIARSHAIIGNVANALALIHHAHRLSQESASQMSNSDDSGSPAILNVEVSSDAAQFLSKLLDGELQRHRAIVHIDNLRKEGKEDAPRANKLSLVERLNEYPAGGVDLNHVVEFPPELALIPMKPIFLDVAWNYIDYPNRHASAQEPAQQTAGKEAANQEPQQTKRGWFGFGR